MFQNEIDILKRFNLPEDTINKYDLLILPENFDNAKDIDELYDTDDSIYLLKNFREKNFKCASLIDLGIEIHLKERRGGDIWLGTMWVLNNILLPLYLGVLSNYLYNFFRSKKNDIHNIEKNNVHLKLRIKENNTFSSLEYDGDSETLLKILERNGDNRK